MNRDIAASDRVQGRYDPDRWSRRWTLAAGIALLVSFLLPHGWMEFGTASGRSEKWHWEWSWDRLQGMDTLGQATTVVPAMLGLGALFVVWRFAGRRRGGALLALSLALLAGRGALQWMYLEPPWEQDAQGGYGANFFATEREVSAVAGCVGIAVGNHLSRHDPTRNASRILRGGGGALVLFALLAPLRDQGTVRFIEVWGDYWGVAWPYWTFVAGLTLYALLAVLPLPDPKWAALRCRWLGRVGRLLLLGLVALYVWPAWSSPAEPRDAVKLLAAALRFDGRIVIYAVGLAAFLEGTRERQSATSDNGRTAQALRTE